VPVPQPEDGQPEASAAAPSVADATGLKIGAYDPENWAGLVLSDGPGRGLAVRFEVERQGERAEGMDFMYLVHEVGPHEPNGQYARLSFDLSLPLGLGPDTPVVDKRERSPDLVIEWTRQGDSVVLLAHAEFEGVLRLVGYLPWD